MPSRVVEVDFHVGQTVFFRLASSPEPGFVTGISITGAGTCYFVTWADKVERRHYAFELSPTPCYERSGA